MISQVNYIGSFIKPSGETLSKIQKIIDDFCLGNIRCSKDRLYINHSSGGMGLINLEDFFEAQQAAWILRADQSTRDNWRVDLRNISGGNLLALSSNKVVDRNLHPILYTLIESFGKVRLCFDRSYNNFLNAFILDNEVFKRGSRNPPIMNAEYFGMNNNNIADSGIVKLKWKDCFTNGIPKTREEFNDLDCVFDDDTYLKFRENLLKLRTSFARKHNLDLIAPDKLEQKFFHRNGKVNSRAIHAYLRVNKNVKKNLSKLRTVKTFFSLINCDIPDDVTLKKILGLWNTSLLCNKFRTFLFKFQNNSLGINTRTSHFANVNRNCTLCERAGVTINEESFLHLFFECTELIDLRDGFISKYFGDNIRTSPLNEKKLFWFTGTCPNTSDGIRLAVLLAQSIFWEFKLAKKKYAFNTFAFIYEERLVTMIHASKKIRHNIFASIYPISRLAGRRQQAGPQRPHQGRQDPPRPPDPPRNPDPPARDLLHQNLQLRQPQRAPPSQQHQPPAPPPLPPGGRERRRQFGCKGGERRKRLWYRSRWRRFRSRKCRRSNIFKMAVRLVDETKVKSEEEHEGVTPEGEEDVKVWLRNIVPDVAEDQSDLFMDTGILDEDDNF